MKEELLLTPEERRLRDLLWAAHACHGKYCNDGEIQCGCFLPPIDFLRDKPEDIEAKIPLHYAQLAKVQRLGLDRADREKIACLICGRRASTNCMLVFENLSCHWCEKASKITDQIVALMPEKEIRADSEEIAVRIIERLDVDISDRRGLKWEWEKIDGEVMNGELKPTWRKIITEELALLPTEEEIRAPEREKIPFKRTIIGEERSMPNGTVVWFITEDELQALKEK